MWAPRSSNRPATVSRSTRPRILYRVRKEDRCAKAVGIFDGILKRRRPDLVVADGAYELEEARTPEGWAGTRPPFVFLWDFMKVYPGSWRWRDVRTARLVNKGWTGAFAGSGGRAGRTALPGDPEDVPTSAWDGGCQCPEGGGGASPLVAGNPLPFDPDDYRDRGGAAPSPGICARAADRLLLRETAVETGLLRLCHRRPFRSPSQGPGRRMVLVKGPRMDADGPPPWRGGKGVRPATVRALRRGRPGRRAGGGGSTLELSVFKRPFLYFPPEGHSEQEFNVAMKLERNGLGVRCRNSRDDRTCAGRPGPGEPSNGLWNTPIFYLPGMQERGPGHLQGLGEGRAVQINGAVS